MPVMTETTPQRDLPEPLDLERWERQETVWRELAATEGFTLLRAEDFRDTREFRKLPLFSQSLPFQIGGAVWERFEGFCAKCEQPVAPENLRGRIHHPLESVAVMDALGWCRPCHTLTAFKYRMHRDFRLSGFREEDWSVWAPKRSWGWKKRLAVGLFGALTLTALAGVLLGVYMWFISG